MFIYPVHEDYFTVFNSNAHLIGKVNDEGIRTEIVEIYTLAKGLLDSLRYNNALVGKFEEYYTKALHTHLLYDEQQRDKYGSQLKDYAPSLVSQHAEFVRRAEALIANLSN